MLPGVGSIWFDLAWDDLTHVSDMVFIGVCLFDAVWSGLDWFDLAWDDKWSR